MRRWLLGAVAAALMAVFGAAAWSFVWPSPDVPREVALGRLSDFAPGTVASFGVTSEGAHRLSPADDYGARPPDYPDEGRSVVHLVRLPDGQVRAFSGADEIFGWTIVWYPLARDYWLADESSVPGRFAEPRRGSFWDIEGQRVFGPAPGPLTPLDVEVLADGMVILDALPIHSGTLKARCSIVEPSRSSGDGTLHVTCDS